MIRTAISCPFACAFAAIPCGRVNTGSLKLNASKRT